MSVMSVSEAGLQMRARRVVDAGWFQRLVISVIIINAIFLGLETSPRIMQAAGPLIIAIDRLALAFFTLEIGLKLFVHRRAFFANGWNLFDFAVVAVAFVPAGQGLSVMRALRVLRALRLMSMVPKMRTVVQALLGAIPAMGAVITLLALVFYVFAVMATKLFGATFPTWFGSVGASLYSLFQIMTLESWSMGIVRPVMEQHPLAWAFFVPFILMTTFAVMNLFVAIVVNSMQSAHNADLDAAAERQEDILRDLRRQIVALRGEVAALRDTAAP